MNSVFYSTPFSGLKITVVDKALSKIEFVHDVDAPQTTGHPLLKQALSQLSEYVENAEFSFALPLNPQGTEFQRKVWSALQKIPVGQVKTYGELAKIVNSSPRAVGNACRHNPIPLIIPCHRVISAQGIGGFSGDTEGRNISIKQQLLAHEGVEI